MKYILNLGRNAYRDLNQLRFLATASKTKSLNYPSEAVIVEVGARDGLQNEPQYIPVDKKIKFIDMLSQTGLERIEVTSFVSPKWIPQFVDAKEVMNKINRNPAVRYSTLTPNLKGFNSALASDSQEIAIFGAASETFTKKNINMTIDDSLANFAEVTKSAKENSMLIRGYVSCVVGCPYEGQIKPKAVCRVVERLLDMGCYEVSLGDTIGVGNPKTINLLLNELKRVVGNKMSTVLAIHCHDTYGMALANIMQALENGIRVIDSSCAGLGGCPYAKGASGNVATEDVLYLLEGLGVKTGVSLERILETSQFILGVLGREPISKVAKAIESKRSKAKI